MPLGSNLLLNTHLQRSWRIWRLHSSGRKYVSSPSGSPAEHRLTGGIPVTFCRHNLWDPCLRAFENQTRVIGWPGYVQEVKLGETNLGGARGEVAGVPAWVRCSSAQCQCQWLALCGRGRGERATGHGPRGEFPRLLSKTSLLLSHFSLAFLPSTFSLLHNHDQFFFLPPRTRW